MFVNSHRLALALRPLAAALLGLCAYVADTTVSAAASAPGTKLTAAELTAGWTPVLPLRYDIQKAWNVDVEERHLYDPAKDMHRMWALHTDKSHQPAPNKTGPRTELRFWPEYLSGEHMFEADVYIVRPTIDACVMQIWGSALSATTMMLHVRAGGDLMCGDTVLLKDAYDRWFHLRVIHNVAGAGDVKIFINEELRSTRPGRGFRKDGGGFYFKCGVYGVKGDRAEAWFRHIKIWERTRTTPHDAPSASSSTTASGPTPLPPSF